VNESTLGAAQNQIYPVISHDSSGGFVVAWHTNFYDFPTFDHDVFARRFDSSGGAVGAPFQLNEYTTSDQRSPAISHDASGGFVVVWDSRYQDGSLYGVFARRFNSSGSPLGGDFQVNQFTTGYQRFPTISHDSSGGFVVAWGSEQDGSGYGIFGRRFNSSGNGVGAEFQVNQYTTNYQTAPTISHDSSGGFVVAWQSYLQDGSFNGVFGRRFDSSGSPLGGEFQVNQFTTLIQYNTTISHDSFGGFVVAWWSYSQDGSGFGVFARRFNSSGTPIGGEFQANQYTPSFQTFPTISHDPSDPAGGFVAAWQSFVQDGSGLGVFGRFVPGPLVTTGPAPGGASLVRRRQRN
jgi:hypothetical protein